MEIEYQSRKTAEKVYFRILHNEKYNNSGVGSSTESVVTCHTCGNKGHLKINFKFKRNGSDG